MAKRWKQLKTKTDSGRPMRSNPKTGLRQYKTKTGKWRKFPRLHV